MPQRRRLLGLFVVQEHDLIEKRFCDGPQLVWIVVGRCPDDSITFGLIHVAQITYRVF